jgi:hypothetical protein
MPDTSSIHLTIVDGRRQPLPAGTDVLIRLLNGAKTIPPIWSKGGDVTINDIPFTDTGNDAYNVFVHAKGYDDAVTPNRVPLIAGRTTDAALMATPKGAKFHFLPWNELIKADARIVNLVKNGTDDPARRYSETMESSNRPLGALLDLATAIRDIPLADGGSPLDDTYYWQVMWDQLAPDRLWAWVDARLADQIKKLADLNAFGEEPDSAHWHPGIPGVVDPATRSWKQTRFDVSNVQLTFHETTKKKLNGVDCVVIEPDIDLFKDLLAHGLFEVLPNAISGGKTNPLAVYSMRWMASRQEHGVPPFDPPVSVE